MVRVTLRRRDGKHQGALPLLGRAAAAIGVMLAVIGMPTAAEAGKPFVHTPFSDSGSVGEPDFCGIAVQIEWTESGTTVVRPVKGSDGQAYFGHTNFEFTEVISTSTGSITAVTRKVFHEQRATHVQGDVWQFEWLDVGTFSVYDSSGNLLLRASGVFKATQQFDTLGDGAPGGQPVADTFEVLSEHGRTFDDATFCDAVLPHLT